MNILKLPLIGVTIIICFLFFVSSYSGYIYPSFLGKYFFVLGLIFPVLFFVMVGLLLFWWMVSKKVLVYLLLLFLLCMPRVLVYSPIHYGSNDSIVAPQLKVISYNIHGRYNSDKEKITNYLLNSGADILALQEYVEGKQGTSSMTSRLKKKYPFYRFNPSINTPYISQGLALFSKYPIISSKIIKYDSKYNSSVLYTINNYRNGLTLINNHFETTGLSGNDRQYIKNLVAGSEVKEQDVPKRLVRTLAKSATIRAKQAVKVADVIETIKTPLIVCGDFNDTPLSYTYQKIASSLQDAYRRTGFGPGFTFNTSPFMVRIDHLLFSSHLVAISSKIENIQYSDHYPVLVNFIWKDSFVK